MTQTTSPTDQHSCSSERVAHNILALVADHPGACGRLRCARIVGGYAVPNRDEQEAVDLARYALTLDWPLREITRLVDALASGGLIAQTSGPRPVLVLTRAGHRALDALAHDHSNATEVT